MKLIDGKLYSRKPIMMLFEGDTLEEATYNIDSVFEDAKDSETPITNEFLDESSDSYDPIGYIESKGFDPYTGLDAKALQMAYEDKGVDENGNKVNGSSWYDTLGKGYGGMDVDDLRDYVNQAYGGEGGIDRTLNFDYDSNDLSSRNNRAGQNSRLGRLNDAAEAYYYANSKALTGKQGGSQGDRARNLLQDRDTLNKVYNAGKEIINMRTQDPHLTGNKYGNFIGFDGTRSNSTAKNAVSNKSLSDRWDQYAREQLNGGKSKAWSFIDNYNPYSTAVKANDLALDLMGKGVDYNQARQLAEDWMDKEGAGQVAGKTINALMAANTAKDLVGGIKNMRDTYKSIRSLAKADKNGNVTIKGGWVDADKLQELQKAANNPYGVKKTFSGPTVYRDNPYAQAMAKAIGKSAEKAALNEAKEGVAGIIPSAAAQIALSQANAEPNSTKSVTTTDINGKSNTYSKAADGTYTVNGKSAEGNGNLGLGKSSETKGSDITFNPQSTWDGTFKSEPSIFTGKSSGRSSEAVNPVTGSPATPPYIPDQYDKGLSAAASGLRAIPSDTFTGDDSASVDTPQTNIPTQSGYNNNAVQEQADKQRQINRSNGRIGLSEDPNRTNYDVDDWNRGMTSQSSELVSDKDCKGFVIAIAKKEPAIADWMNRVANYYRR